MLRQDWNSRQFSTWIVLGALLTIGVLGRLFQPEWHVTPIVAVTLFASLLIESYVLVSLLPVGILLVSNYWLPAYWSNWEMITVIGCLAMPLLMHRWLRNGANSWSEFLPRLGCAALTPALIFFVVTNFVVWLEQRGAAYDNSWAGLVECYYNAIPFFRYMVQGDLLYVVTLFSSYAALMAFSNSRAKVHADARA
jgi:hypothetical protein